MDAAFVLTMLGLDELKEMGYREAWIGAVESPHLRHTGPNFVVAGPKRRRDNSWPAIWSVSERIFGSGGCCNGLTEADRVSRTGVAKMVAGHYKLIGGAWHRMESGK